MFSLEKAVVRLMPFDLDALEVLVLARQLIPGVAQVARKDQHLRKSFELHVVNSS